MNVIIDGIKYVPAKTVIPNHKDFVRALLLEWWGVASDADVEKYGNDPGVRVFVNDNGEGVPISKIIENLAEVSETNDWYEISIDCPQCGKGPIHIDSNSEENILDGTDASCDNCDSTFEVFYNIGTDEWVEVDNDIIAARAFA